MVTTSSLALRIPTVAKRLETSERYVWGVIRAPVDPLPVVRLGRKATRVLESDLVAWLERRKATTSDVDRIFDEVLG